MEPRRIEDALSFTPGEVARILNIDPPTARVLLQTLEDSHFLKHTRDGRFTRAVHHG